MSKHTRLARVTADAIVNMVAEMHDISRSDLLSGLGPYNTAARHILTAVLREVFAGATSADIGAYLGRDASTVRYSVRKVKQDLVLRSTFLTAVRQCGGSR